MPESIDLLVHNTSELMTARPPRPGPVRRHDLDSIEIIPDGAAAIRDGKFVAVGTSAELRARYRPARELDAGGHLVTPAFSDPHTHLIHGGSRHAEWESKVLEQPSPGIDGGIRSTITATADASDDDLLEHAAGILDDMLASGTTAIETKSGYGLNRDAELRLLSLAADIRHPITISSTFLGAHTVPERLRDDRGAYISEIIEMLPAARRLADTCDIAIDPVSFTPEEGRRLIAAAVEHGFRLRFHADQTADIGGTGVAVEAGALTVDHLDFVSDAGLRSLADSPTLGVIFPAANMHLLDVTPGRDSHPPRNLVAWADRLIDSGAALALSTDYNPGTAPCTSMQLVMQLAARLYRISFAAAWNLSTLNAAHAIGAGDSRGSIEVGKDADFVLWRAEAHGQVVHRLGSNLASGVYIRGALVASDGRRIEGNE
ncbi:imidazolonepropionase [Leucobacter allii]|uniref:imidazolonepropionase n=1 Tax=Leucobacter allii TaxID=2932247 RepID=UPI001FD4FDC3|nr:imidazolonepropionase [Leucobacter allii]UOR02168.1 imidazolonepropionase [Leucobacter allii]